MHEKNNVLLGYYWGNIQVLLGYYRGNIVIILGIMEENIETTVMG